MQKLLKNKLFAGLVIGLLITCSLSAMLLSGKLGFWQLKMADILFGNNNPSKDIIIVAIDDKSTQVEPFGLGRYTQWGRDNYANLLDALAEENPKVIAFDIIFNNPSQNVKIDEFTRFQQEADSIKSDSDKLKAYENFVSINSDPYDFAADNLFAQKIKQAGNVILALAGNEQSRILPIKKFRENAQLGFVVANPDEDGILRRITPTYTYLDDTELALGLVAANKFSGESAVVPLEDGEMLVNYFSDPFGYKMIPFIDVINGDFEKGIFKDKIVLVGITSFKEIQDKALTPRSNEIPMPGVEVHANIIQTILDGKFLHNQSRGSQVATIAGMAIGLTIAFNFVGILLSIALALAAGFGYFFMAHFFFDRGLIVNMLYPFVAILLSYVFAWVYRYFIADKKKREISSAFGHYVSSDLVSEISKNPDMLKLGGEKRIVTVFFSDIQDSTMYSESTEIQAWVAQLNEYFTAMEGIIKKLGGTLDKYEGDAIMGFWNAPIAQADHISRAYLAAIEMQKMLGQLHLKWQQEGKPLIQFRIGINTGMAIVGNIGSADRFDYTVMGDTVNTASRLESAANKAYGSLMMVAGLKENLPQFTLREIDTVLLPGKKTPLQIYELVGLTQEISPDTQKILQNYSEGLAAYRSKDFAKAGELFRLNPNDKPSQVMLARCEKLQKGESIAELNQEMVFTILNK